MTQVHDVKVDLGQGAELALETGKIAKLANGAVTVTLGDTVVLVTVCSAEPRPGIDFFPLQVDYREKYSAAGVFPGGFFKREGRPSEKEILTARMTDRPLRPLFPEGFMNEVQIMTSLLSVDGENDPDVLSMFGASAALTISDIPWNGPLGALRVGRVNGEFIANPTREQVEVSDIDLVYAGLEGKTIMIEGKSSQISEEDLRDALYFADEIIQRQCAALRELAEKAGKQKHEFKPAKVDDDVEKAVKSASQGRIEEPCMILDKTQRYAALDALRDQLLEELTSSLVSNERDESEVAKQLKQAFDTVTQKCVRRLLLKEGKRSDHRGPKDLRDIECEVGVLPRTHGSALFSRGETQALMSVTLGGEKDAQGYDDIAGLDMFGKKTFMLHYNFPPFSVGECGRIAGPGRREIGHGALAERSVAQALPEECPYTIRCVSDIMGSNGSTSMASICSASLALMDAGIELPKHVAGISVGMVTDDDSDERIFITDILGSEDHYGDMDFKIAGTRDGITGFQLDLKIAGLDIAGMYEAMLQNREAREKILDTMESCISTSRERMSKYAPKMRTVKINPEKISVVIGPGGKTIRELTEKTSTTMDVQEDGTVKILGTDEEGLNKALKQVHLLVAEVELGKVYKGVVKQVKDFGAIVEILPGQSGLCHISELADYRVDKVEDICGVGDTMSVKVKNIDKARGRIGLSRKDALADD